MIPKFQATFAGELFLAFNGFDCIEFYKVTAPCALKSVQCNVRHGYLLIGFEKGMCDVAIRKNRTQIFDNVHQVERHIACAASAKSK